MPTTATVAPGLREFASFLDTHPDVLALRRSPEVTIHLSYILINADAVEVVARQLGTTVKTATHKQDTHVATLAVFGGLEVSFVSVQETPRVLRRDPGATVDLAERDA